MSIAYKIYAKNGPEDLLDLMKGLNLEELDNLFTDEWGEKIACEDRDQSHKWGSRDVFIGMDWDNPEDSTFCVGYENISWGGMTFFWVGRGSLKAEDMEVGTYYVQMSKDSDGDIVEAGFKLSEDCWRMTYIINDMNDDAVNSRIANEYSDINFFKKDGTRIEL